MTLSLHPSTNTLGPLPVVKRERGCGLNSPSAVLEINRGAPLPNRAFVVKGRKATSVLLCHKHPERPGVGSRHVGIQYVSGFTIN